VFRHFPTKDGLLAAVVLDRIESLTATARGLTSGPDAGAALHDFVAEVAGRQQQLDLSFLRGSGDLNERLGTARLMSPSRARAGGRVSGAGTAASRGDAEIESWLVRPYERSS
jgi:AcrR family transcriptional regulator